MLKLPCRSRFIVLCRALGSGMARKAVPVDVMYKVKVTRKAACGIELQSLLQQRLFFLKLWAMRRNLFESWAGSPSWTYRGRNTPRGWEREKELLDKECSPNKQEASNVDLKKCCQVGAQMSCDIMRWRKRHSKWEMVNAAETKCAHLVARCYKVVKRKWAHAKIEISLLPELNVSSF